MAAGMETRRKLYGPERLLHREENRSRLTRSHVLQDGEYNFTNNKLRRNVWDTSHSTDFTGSIVDANNPKVSQDQLAHHFEMGNMSGKHVQKDVYAQSTTQGDFDQKDFAKPAALVDAGGINWPDMNPQYAVGRRIGPSEYHSSFMSDLRNQTRPIFPRVDTSKMKLPLDPEKFWRQRNTNLSLGSDGQGLISEQQRSFGRGDMAFTTELELQGETKGVSQKMKALDKVSHVFRDGDYNDIAGNFVSTCVGDYGPRTVPPGEAALEKAKRNEEAGDEEEEEGEEQKDSVYANVNRLQQYARQCTVPIIFKEASEGGAYQTGTHFNFGHDDESGHSIYNKDYTLSSMLDREAPKFYSTPSAGRLLQFDPNQSKFGITSSSVDFQNHDYLPYMNSKGKTAMEINLEQRNTDNVVFSFDLSRSTQDRQKSINHRDYTGPPTWYRSMQPVARPRVVFDYLQTDDALPYPPPAKDTSEAMHNFSAPTGTERRAVRDQVCKNKLEDGRSTHFVVGYNPFDLVSETKIKFQGRKKGDQGTPAAGKTETVHPVKFSHLSLSANQEDLQAGDPHRASTQESLLAQMNYVPTVFERSNTTSIMKKDYGPIVTRSMTDAQLRTVDKYDKVLKKDIASSHFFHTDNSGRNNFVTTAMDDFIKPETMTGRKYLAAR